jgi:acetylglutamate kinase
VTRVVLKLGGRVAAAEVQQAVALHDAGHEVVVVHGAGPQISEELSAHGIPVKFRDGRRVTDEATLGVVRRLLVSVGSELASALGPAAVHLVGDEIGLQARRLPELGFVGEPIPGPAPAIEAALAAGLIPVVTPVAEGPLNVNADEAAAALAAGLEADRILFVSDVPGVYLGGSVVDRLHADDADELLGRGAFEGGIVPKLLAAVGSARLGITAQIGATEVLA